jgi:hypothetical protein
MKILIFDSAKLDLADGFHFYERQGIGVGEYFLESLYSDIDSLVLYAGVHLQKSGFYWMLSRRFPFAIYYTLDEKRISVHAILDCRRNPVNIEQRLTEERLRKWH